jgi:3-deoxy-manno-octulosonate cytidylyltransferase (CMP-KDO synthetase)
MDNMSMSKPTVLIPSHLESKRLPAKALSLIGGVPMVIRCAQQATLAGLETYVCSDSAEILETCKQHRIDSISTPSFSTGTDRCAWAAEGLNHDRFIILQGDEPLIGVEAIKIFAHAVAGLNTIDALILNGLSLISDLAGSDHNNVKASINRENDILYLSRLPIFSEVTSCTKNTETNPIASKNPGRDLVSCVKQLGLYGCSLSSLKEFRRLPKSPLEKRESIEMLRWIVNNRRLKGILLDTPGISVDTANDLAEASQWLASHEAVRSLSPSSQTSYGRDSDAVHHTLADLNML